LRLDLFDSITAADLMVWHPDLPKHVNWITADLNDG